MSKPTILFDLDGTLLDSTDAILASFLHAFTTRKTFPTPTKEMITKVIGYPLDIMFVKCGVDEDEAPLYVNEYKLFYREISLPQTTLLPYALKAIELASTFATLGIVTTKTASYTIPLLEHLNIMQYFATLVGREHVINPKPHPEPILLALNNLGMHPSSNIWMIGDTILDLEAAQKAQVNALGVLCGYGSKEELENNCKNVFINSYDAVKFIQNQVIH